MPILSKAEKKLILEKWENDIELTQEEISDLQETFDWEQGIDQPRRREVIDENGNWDWEYID